MEYWQNSETVLLNEERSCLLIGSNRFRGKR